MSRADSYRQKVYDSESAWLRDEASQMMVSNTEAKMVARKISVEDAQFIVNDLAQDFGIDPVVLVVNSRLKQWAGWYVRQGRAETGWKPTIEFKHSVITYKTMLHEFAHHLDAQRRENYDGKGHGGSFTEAMLDVVDHHIGGKAMVALMRSYENQGAIVGASESRKVADRTRSGVSRRQSRHGIIEEAWAIRIIGSQNNYWLEQDKTSMDRYLSRAGVWKRRTTAEAVANAAATMSWDTEVVKVRAQLDTLYSNRWWAIEEVEG